MGEDQLSADIYDAFNAAFGMNQEIPWWFYFQW
jgi:hypothetical protein